MKKAISLFLALVMCLSLCACGGGEQSGKNPGTDNDPADNTQNKEKIDLICGITWWYELGNPQFDFGRKFYEDGDCVPAAGGYPTGTWTLEGDVISITSAKPNSNQVFEYQLKTHNGVHFLIGEQDTWVSVKNNEIPSKIPTKKVSISLDNWQEYFEYITFSQTSKKIDIWGTATEETATYGVLKLKDEYSSRLVKIVSEADAKFTIAGAEDRMENLVAGRLYSIIDYPEPGGTYGEFQGQELYFIGEAMELDEEQVNSASFEMTDIQGTLYFIDIE